MAGASRPPRGAALLRVLGVLSALGAWAGLAQERFHCATESCAPSDSWVQLNFSNSTQTCIDAQDAVLNSFVREAPSRCRATAPWRECKSQYCAAFERALNMVAHLGGPGFHGGEECRPFLAFNRTICEEHYRDADAFCSCLCPAMRLFAPQYGCEDEIMRFLVLGHRGPVFAQNYSVRPFCAPYLCQWFEKIGDPNPPYPVEGVPPVCHGIHLPFRLGQCRELVTRQPYDPSPWDTPNAGDNLLKCSDQTEHLVDGRHADSWAACGDHDYRWQCPRNFPVMCAGRHCMGSSDHCCRTRESECREGRAREVSFALAMDLPEWRGLLTPAEAARRVTTTTLDPMQVYLNRPEAAVAPTGFADWVEPYLPYIITVGIPVGFAGCIGICLCLGARHSRFVRKTIIGPRRLFRSFHADPVSIFMPKDALPKTVPELPPLKEPDWQETEAVRLDRTATAALRNTVRRAEGHGFNHVATSANAPALGTAAPLRRAIEEVRARGLEDKQGNAALIARGEKWLKTLEAEQELFRATEAARPLLHIVGQKLTAPPLPGVPWHTTRTGRAAEGEIQRGAWQQVEVLSEAMRIARGAAASDVQLQSASELLAQLVARTPELPADRCVLDPEGDGLRLLPMGTQRAVWTETGESYTFKPGSETAGGLGEPLPPREQLGEVSVDDSRPVCAEWAKRRTCRAGRRCPWRHVTPQAGDSIRECIVFEDV